MRGGIGVTVGVAIKAGGQVGLARAVSHEPTRFDNFTVKIDRREPVLYREIYHLCSTNIDHKASQFKDRFSTHLGCGAERSFYILGIKDV